MATKSTDWRPGPTVCRCCLSEGCYKDISTEYFWMGKREVYAEMLLNAFNLTISYSQSGGPNSNSRLICEPCISRLRDATDFKRQVQECEKTFTQYLDPGVSSIVEQEVPVEELESDVKVELVKQEKLASDDDDDFDDRTGFGDDDDDDDDLDDQPLTKLASKVPKKESVDILDLLDNAKAALKRKSTTKTKPAPAKKTKTTKKEAKPTSSNTKTVKVEKKKKEAKPMSVARRNAKLIVKYTTAYPFKLPECALVCVYCREEYESPPTFREHMRDSHPEVNIRLAFSHIPHGYIKIDCTELACRICLETHETLESITDHLANVHDIDIDLNNDMGVQPFMFHKDMWACAICSTKLSTLRTLSRHTQSHFQKYTCEQCGKSYFAASALRSHMLYCQMPSDLRVCVKCKKIFKTLEAKRNHLKESPRCWVFTCKDCGERFITDSLKKEHRAQVHGEQSRTYQCPECSLVFPDRKKYRLHFVLSHTEEYFTCTCGRKFVDKCDLEKHRVIHSKEKLFPCTTCPKAFSTKKSLSQHMWIHSEIKRFECVQCDKKFNQRVTYKSHMKSYHPELEITF